ncbi:hypothetical protein ASD24_14975 [Paenibacillus sp. Root52]|uniref:Membrane protein n=1 Tax=Paenibacillus amylolyticus TaxID=1451 RepID=A0AAP5H2A0_PAEAM|nr:MULTISPECIES: hypothetical protein [Paenibacillus]KQY82683.1 hypothetical protein ASD24_14975 [Paenibacillus sp. Root52]MDR6723418.1 putative membrane protein [Paenibacillus amylolyticus]
MNAKMPTLLNIIRALLGVQSIYIIISMVAVLMELFQYRASFAGFPLFDQIAYFASILLRIILIVGPPILTILYISKRRYKLTITFMSMTLFFGLVFLQNFLVVLHFFMLLVLLLHQPIKRYLKQEQDARQYDQRSLRL